MSTNIVKRFPKVPDVIIMGVTTFHSSSLDSPWYPTGGEVHGIEGLYVAPTMSLELELSIFMSLH
jgi:hypothetical protein